MGGGSRLSALLVAALPLLCANSPPRAPCGGAVCWSGALQPRRGAEPWMESCMRLRGGWKERKSFAGGRPLRVGKKAGLSLFPGAAHSRDPLRQLVERPTHRPSASAIRPLSLADPRPPRTTV